MLSQYTFILLKWLFVDVFPDNTVMMIVVLDKQWKDIYNDSTNEETMTVTGWITDKVNHNHIIVT
jgi:hypothetical protein